MLKILNHFNLKTNISKSYISNKIVLFIFLIIPFLQLGYDYYLSVSFIAFLILIFLSRNILYGNKYIFNIILIASLLFLVKVFILIFIFPDLREIFIPLREAFCFVGLIFISRKISKTNFNNERIKNLIFLVLLLILVLVSVQTYFISIGQYFGIPIDWYVFNKETLVSSEMALYHGTRYRATSFYGEPSYTAWIVLSLLMILTLKKEFSLRIKIYGFIICFVIVFISMSFAGIISMILYLIFFLFNAKEFKGNRKQAAFFLITIFMFLIVGLMYSNDITSRLLDVFSSKDDSSNIRFVEPLVILNKMISNGEVFGVSNFSGLDIDNAALGLLIHYGILIVPLFILFFKFLKSKPLIFYILLSLNFNGTLFRFDKIIILSLVIGFSECILYQKKKSQQIEKSINISV